MFDNDKIKSNFSEAAGRYEENAHLQKIVRSDALALAIDYFVANAEVLDLGCGAKPVHEAKWQVTGLDIAYGMCRVAKKNCPSIVNACAEHLPFPDESFDGVFSSLMLQWIERPEVVIKEILRVLKPNGIAVISTFTEGTLAELKKAFKSVDGDQHINDFIHKDRLLMRMAHVGATVIDVQEDTHEQEIESVDGLMKSIKIIGAGNKQPKRKKGLMTKARFEKLEAAYEGSIASWETLIMVLAKTPDIVLND